MRLIIIVLFLGLFAHTAHAQGCDIAQSGVVVYNSSNTNPVTDIRVGETANFRFSIRNESNGNSCAIPANTVTAVFDFPTISGNKKPFVYAGPPSFVSGYFTWIYNFAAEVLVGTNSREIPAGTTDLNISMRVRGNAVGSGNSNLNITQGKGIADNIANNFSGARLTVTAAGVPPIKLKSFVANTISCEVQLKWSTDSEDAGNFEIEFSTDGYNFKKIGTVPGRNIATGADYEFTYNPANEKGYYRLKLQGTNGEIAYSNDLFAAANCGTKGKISVYPNPVSYQRKLVVNVSGYTGKINGELFDASGRKVQSYSLVNSINELSVENISAGTYLLYVREEGGNEAQSFKIIVTR